MKNKKEKYNGINMFGDPLRNMDTFNNIMGGGMISEDVDNIDYEIIISGDEYSAAEDGEDYPEQNMQEKEEQILIDNGIDLDEILCKYTDIDGSVKYGIDDYYGALDFVVNKNAPDFVKFSDGKLGYVGETGEQVKFITSDENKLEQAAKWIESNEYGHYFIIVDADNGLFDNIKTGMYLSKDLLDDEPYYQFTSNKDDAWIFDDYDDAYYEMTEAVDMFTVDDGRSIDLLVQETDNPFEKPEFLESVKKNYVDKTKYKEFLNKWKRLSKLVGEYFDNVDNEDTIDEQNQLIIDIEDMLPFATESEHDYWSDVCATYKFWEDFEDLTLMIASRLKGANVKPIEYHYDYVDNKKIRKSPNKNELPQVVEESKNYEKGQKIDLSKYDTSFLKKLAKGGSWLSRDEKIDFNYATKIEPTGTIMEQTDKGLLVSVTYYRWNKEKTDKVKKMTKIWIPKAQLKESVNYNELLKDAYRILDNANIRFDVEGTTFEFVDDDDAENAWKLLARAYGKNRTTKKGLFKVELNLDENLGEGILDIFKKKDKNKKQAQPAKQLWHIVDGQTDRHAYGPYDTKEEAEEVWRDITKYSSNYAFRMQVRPYNENLKESTTPVKDLLVMTDNKYGITLSDAIDDIKRSKGYNDSLLGDNYSIQLLMKRFGLEKRDIIRALNYKFDGKELDESKLNEVTEPYYDGSHAYDGFYKFLKDNNIKVKKATSFSDYDEYSGVAGGHTFKTYSYQPRNVITGPEGFLSKIEIDGVEIPHYVSGNNGSRELWNERNFGVRDVVDLCNNNLDIDKIRGLVSWKDEWKKLLEPLMVDFDESLKEGKNNISIDKVKEVVDKYDNSVYLEDEGYVSCANRKEMLAIAKELNIDDSHYGGNPADGYFIDIIKTDDLGESKDKSTKGNVEAIYDPKHNKITYKLGDKEFVTKFWDEAGWKDGAFEPFYKFLQAAGTKDDELEDIKKGVEDGSLTTPDVVEDLFGEGTTKFVSELGEPIIEENLNESSVTLQQENVGRFNVEYRWDKGYQGGYYSVGVYEKGPKDVYQTVVRKEYATKEDAEKAYKRYLRLVKQGKYGNINESLDIDEIRNNLDNYSLDELRDIFTDIINETEGLDEDDPRVVDLSDLYNEVDNVINQKKVNESINKPSRETIASMLRDGALDDPQHVASLSKDEFEKLVDYWVNNYNTENDKVTESRHTYKDCDGDIQVYNDWGVEYKETYKNAVIVYDEDRDKYTIWSTQSNRPLSKFRRDNSLEPIWFNSIDEVKKYVDKDNTNESLKESSTLFNFSKPDILKIRKWWRDVDDYYSNSVDLDTLDDPESIDDWFVAIWDILVDLKKDGSEEAKKLLRRGKSIYNKYGISQFNESVNVKKN